MSAPKQLVPNVAIASGDVCFQTSAKGDYQDEAHFLAVMQPMFDSAARRNGVTFGALVVDVTSAPSLDNVTRDLYRATAAAT